MGNIYQVQVTRQGVITLPKDLCERAQIKEGDSIMLFELEDGVIVMRPRHLRTQAAVDEFAPRWQESGETLGQVLAAMREAQAEYDAKNPSSIYSKE